MGVGSAAVVIESRGIGEHCKSATATWDWRWPDKEGPGDQEVLSSKICQVSTICCIIAVGAMIIYHQNTRDPLPRKEPLTVMEDRVDSGRRAQIAFKTTGEEHNLGVPQTTQKGRELAE